LNTCIGVLSNINSNIEVTLANSNFYYNKWFPCSQQDLPTCTRELNDYTRKYDQEKAGHAAWKALPHYSCERESNSQAVSDIEWDRSKQQCEIIQRDKQTLANEYTSFMSIYYQNKVDKSTKCMDMRNSAPSLEEILYRLPPVGGDIGQRVYNKADFQRDMRLYYDPNTRDYNMRGVNYSAITIRDIFIEVPVGAYLGYGAIWYDTPRFMVANPMTINLAWYVNDGLMIAVTQNDKTRFEVVAQPEKGDGTGSITLLPGHVYMVTSAFYNWWDKGILTWHSMTGVDWNSILIPNR
jgi:hypothetical protein